MRIGKFVWLMWPLGGLLTALCLLFPQIGFLEWFTITPALFALFAYTERENPRAGKLYAAGLCYFAAFYLATYYWFTELYDMAFLDVSRAEGVALVVICWVGLTALQSVFFALIFPLFGWLSRTAPVQKYPLLAPFLAAALYTVGEWCQTLTFAGVPWARLPLGQTECGFLPNSAALFGSYFLTFALVAVNALCAYAILHLPRVRVCAFAACAVFLVSAAAGAVGFLTAKPEEGTPVVAAAVQGNVGSSAKWSTEASVRSYEVYERYTKAAASAGAELVLFPETFIPANATPDTELGKFVSHLARTYHVTILFGAFHTDAEGEEYNAVLTVLPDGTFSDTVYAKRHLVPFGEYVPMRGLIETLIPPLSDLGMLDEDLAAGTESAIVETPAGRVGTLVCFDSIYEELTRASVRDGAEILCLPTNDSWFTDSAAVYMHNAQARLRAIESGRWIVRAADTGVSSIISPTGKCYATQPALREGMALSVAYLREGRTLYGVVGNLFVYLDAAAVALLALSPAVSRLIRKKSRNGAENA